ncbi:MAG: GTPase domain-containing protein [Pseudomonadota bacterium]
MTASQPAVAPGEGTTLSISLVSHTNVGKTTLARTLLGRDIGAVRDEAHVTEVAEPHLLLESADGDRLLLWDTPGFGDSQRLARRLAQAGNPLGWVLTEVWDRWRDRAFWASQRAIRHVLGETDVALYLVNAAEAPEDAGYLASELQVLGLLGKPVLVLLNQLGPPGSAAAEAQQLQQWQAHLEALAARPGSARVQAVLPLDALARCWVQEAVLLQAVAAALPAGQQPAMARLTAAWAQRQRHTWQQAMAVLAQRLARAALDRELLDGAGWRAPLQRLGAALGLPVGEADPQARAMATLAGRLDSDIRHSTDALIRLHGLGGQAGAEVLDQLARHFARREPVSEGRAALWGGAVAGALAGLKADIATGGLTLGGGLLAGGVLGALGAAGAAHGVNRIRGITQPLLAWDDAVLTALLRSALLGYLAVAHHGRGRGDWQPGEPPAAWGEAVDAALATQRDAVQALWRQRTPWLADAAVVAAPADWVAALNDLLSAASADVLKALYPQAARSAGL